MLDKSSFLTDVGWKGEHWVGPWVWGGFAQSQGTEPVLGAPVAPTPDLETREVPS